MKDLAKGFVPLCSSLLLALIVLILSACGRSAYYRNSSGLQLSQIQASLESELSSILEKDFRISLKELEALQASKRFVSKPPTGANNAVDDLAIIDNEDGTYTLTWTYKNVGDYNQDGIVNISDIFTLAEEFLKPDTPENQWVDGNKDGEVSIGDVFPLAENFFSQVAGYEVQGAEAADGEYSEILRVDFASSERDGVLKFSALIEGDLTAVNFIRVRPFDGQSQFGEASNVVETPEVPPPPPPENEPPVAKFTARPVWGIVPFPVEFDPSASYDPDGIISLYEWDFDQDGTFDEASSAPSAIVHIFTEPGTHWVTLKVTDDDGASSTATTVILGLKDLYFSLSGYVLQDNGYGLEGVSITLMPLGATTSTNRDGYYEFEGLTSGVYTIVPSRASWSISPSDSTVYIFDEDVTGTVFSAEWVGSGGRGDWYMFGRDRRHTARGSFNGPKTLKQEGSIPAGTGVVLGQNDELYAIVSRPSTIPEGPPSGLSAFYRDGTLIWSFSLDLPPITYPVIDEGGFICFGARDGFFYRLNPDGTMRWRVFLPTREEANPAISSDGTIYVVGGTRLYSIDSEGTIRWMYTAGGAIQSSPAVADDGTIYFGCDDMKVYALSADGALKWSYETGGMVDSSPAIGDDGTVYIGSEDGKFYAFNPNGTVKWTYQTQVVFRYITPAIAGDGTIYISSPDGYLYALGEDGSLKWRYFAQSVSSSKVHGQVTIGADGLVYLPVLIGAWGDSPLIILNPDGTMVAQDTNANPDLECASPILPDGTLALVTRYGLNLYHD